jgi:hypothetical protein
MTARMLTGLLSLLAAPVAVAGHAACDMALSTTQVDYGRLSRATMPVDAQGMLDLPARVVGIHIRCPEPRDMTVFFRGTPAGSDGFRFMDKGAFALRLRDGRLDGESVELGQVARAGGVPDRTGASVAWVPERGVAPLKNGQAASGREFSANIDIVAQVDDRALTVDDAARWTTTGLVELPASAVSRELTLQADVQPGRCNVEVAHHIAFGQLRATDLNRRGASTRVSAAREGRLHVLCDGPIPFAFRVMRDERAGTAVAPVGLDVTYPDTQLFGLGRTSAGQNIGAYVLQWGMSATSDNGELHASRSVDGGRSWVPARGGVIADHANAERIGYASVRGTTTGPLAVKALDVTLDATIFIAPKASLSLEDQIRADGLMTFEIIY